MRRLTIFAIAICSLLIIAGCSSTASTTPSEPPPQTSIQTTNPAPSEPPSQTPPITPSTAQPELPPPPPPMPPVELPEFIEEGEQSTELITRNYAWAYSGGQWTWELQIPKSLYDYYQGIPRPPTTNYSVYVTHPLDDKFIELIVSKLEKVAQEEGFSELQKVEFATSFVQSLPYTSDSVTTSYDEYPRYPIETLVDNGGDCEDTAILTASLIYQLGYGVVLITFPEHCAVGVLGGEGIYGSYFNYDGDKYFYLETTNTGWEIGVIPEEYEEAKAHIFAMAAMPILTHSWSATGEGSVVELEVIVQNLGSATAYDVYVFAGFDAGGDRSWNAEESNLFQVPINSEVTVTLNLRVPLEKYTRLIIQIVDDGYAVDESYSKWFDT